jgi:chromosome segregation ATPase
MYNYSARIDEISAILQETLAESRRRQRSLGEKYVPLAAVGEGADLVSRYEEITERIERSSSALERMIRIDERQTELRNEMRTVQKELEQAESGRGLAGAYEAVGAAAFRLFREHPLVDATYSTAFSGVARYQDQMRRIETRLQQLQAEPAGHSGSVLDRLSRGSRQVILRNKRAVRKNQLPGLLQKLGRDLAVTDFFDSMDDSELTAAAEPLRETERQKGELRTRINDLSDESKKLVDEFNALSGGARLQKAQKNREDEIAQAQEDLNNVLLQLGEVAEKVRPNELAKDIAALDDERSRARHFSALLDRLETGKKVHELERTIAADENRRNQIDEKITSLQEEKYNLEQEIDRKEQEKAGLIAQRGDEAELFGA